MSRGRFIAFEGGEGTGKSTQASLLAERLRKGGLIVEVTREPGGTEGAEAIRHLLLHPPGEEWGLRAEALLFAAARSDHVEKRIEPALEAGHWVVCDRFIDSSRAYQGGAGGLSDDAVRALHAFGSKGLFPDLAVLIDVPAKTVADRLARRDRGASDAIGGREELYHARVRASFEEFAAAEPERFRTVDGSGAIDDVHARIACAVAQLPGAPDLS